MTTKQIKTVVTVETTGDANELTTHSRIHRDACIAEKMENGAGTVTAKIQLTTDGFFTMTSSVAVYANTVL